MFHHHLREGADGGRKIVKWLHSCQERIQIVFKESCPPIGKVPIYWRPSCPYGEFMPLLPPLVSSPSVPSLAVVVCRIPMSCSNAIEALHIASPWTHCLCVAHADHTWQSSMGQLAALAATLGQSYCSSLKAMPSMPLASTIPMVQDVASNSQQTQRYMDKFIDAHTNKNTIHHLAHNKHYMDIHTI